MHTSSCRLGMQETLLTHRLAAVWFADVVGYSARAAEDERGALQLVEILQALSRETVRRYEGRIVKFIGDAVLAEFPSTALAVEAGAVLSKAYLEQSVATGHSHSLTVGVHVGDVAVSSQGDLYGDTVNAAARIQEAAEPDQVYCGEGIAEEILNALAKVGALHVAARTSCFAFRGTSIDAREIGRRLGVEALLEGSIRKARNRVRISVQLIDARNGYQLWSERFDREIDDIFAIQDEIARSVIDALSLSLTQREERRFLKASTKNVEAYEFYLRARKLFQRWTRQSIELGRQMFERAIELDPHFAAAWAGLATAHVYLFSWGGRDPDLQKAHNAGTRALELDPALADAHVEI